MNVPFVKSSKYYVLFKGDYSGFCFIYCVVTKPRAFSVSKMFTIEFTKTMEIVLAH
jgi:hypothetical protein